VFLVNREDILDQLQSQRDRVNAAIAALKGGSGRRPGREHRTLSAEARRKISQAQKKRWAAQKRK